MQANAGGNSIPSIFVPDVKFEDLAALVSLIYDGKVYVNPSQLPGVTKIARTLQIPTGTLQQTSDEQKQETEIMKPPEQVKPKEVDNDPPANSMAIGDGAAAPEGENEVVQAKKGTDLPITDTPRSSRIAFPPFEDSMDDDIMAAASAEEK